MKQFYFLLLLLIPFIISAQVQIGSDIDGEAGGDNFGNSISLSADGNTVAIGAFTNDGNGGNSGHVRVYQNMAGTWTQVGIDIDGESGSDQSGFSVDISGDASTVAIGAPFNDGGGFNSGHTRVYENMAGTWTQIGVDIDAEAGTDAAGYSVSLSSDGGRVAIGAPFNNGAAGSNTGHVRVYENIAGTWTQVGSDIDGEAINDKSGFSLDLSADGSIVAIGAIDNAGSGAGTGHVRVYENMAGTWMQIGADIDGLVGDNSFGTSVSLSSDGTIFASGMPFTDGTAANTGVVRVYQNIAGTWTQLGADISGELAEDESGHKHAISLSSDGSIIAIGARFNDGNGGASGHTRIYQNISGTWTQVGSDIDGEAPGYQSGYSVSLSSDGTEVAIGAASGGQARVYDLSGVLSIDDFSLNKVSVYPNPIDSHLIIRSNESIDNISIYNILGKKIRDYNIEGDQLVRINMSEYPSGYYLAKVTTANASKTFKLIKN